MKEIRENRKERLKEMANERGRTRREERKNRQGK